MNITGLFYFVCFGVLQALLSQGSQVYPMQGTGFGWKSQSLAWSALAVITKGNGPLHPRRRHASLWIINACNKPLLGYIRCAYRSDPPLHNNEGSDGVQKYHHSLAVAHRSIAVPRFTDLSINFDRPCNGQRGCRVGVLLWCFSVIFNALLHSCKLLILLNRFQIFLGGGRL